MDENTWKKAYALQNATVLQERYAIYGTASVEGLKNKVMSEFEKKYGPGCDLDSFKQSCFDRAVSAFGASDFEAAKNEMARRIEESLSPSFA
jgi:hypothetical protein